MNLNIPFLVFGENESQVGTDMELASAFLYFDLNRTESLKSIFTKQPKEEISLISRGLYTLTAKLISDEDKLYGIYDDLGLVEGSIELDCLSQEDIHMNMAALDSLDARGKIEAIKNMSSDLKNCLKAMVEKGSLLSGYKNIENILKGRDADLLSYLSVDLKGYKKPGENDTALIKNLIGDIEKAIEKEIELLKDLCKLDDDSFKNSITERNSIYEEYKDKIYQTDKEVGSNIARLIMERENKIREVDKIYSDKAAYLTQDYILNKNKYDIAQIYGNEIEMDIYKKSISEAEGRMEVLKKEATEQIKKLEDSYDSLIEVEKEKIKKAISDRSAKVKESESLYAELHSSIDAFKKVVSDDIFGRRKQIEEVKSWFGKIQCIHDCDTINISIPFYIAQYKGADTRYKLFFPSVLKEKNQIMALISGIAGKIPSPFKDRDKFFEDLMGKFKGYLMDEANKPVLDLFLNNNLIYKPGIGEKVEAGIKSLFNGGYLNDKGYEKVLSSIRPIFTHGWVDAEEK